VQFFQAPRLSIRAPRPEAIGRLGVSFGESSLHWILSEQEDVLPENASRWADVVVGLLVVVLSFRRGRIEEQFGNWNRFLI
jgi:hypothetical protein